MSEHTKHTWITGLSGTMYLGHIHHESYTVFYCVVDGLYIVHKDYNALLNNEYLGKFATENEAKRHAEILHAMES